MHRISLRGPWQLALVDRRLTLSRKFHAPKGLAVDEVAARALNVPEAKGGVRFLWQISIDSPLDQLEVNQSPFFAGSAVEPSESGVPFFDYDTTAGIGSLDLTGILKPFNEVVLVWNDWPASQWLQAGRYTPGSHHPLHLDSWLEIQT